MLKKEGFELPIDSTTLLKTKNLINCCGLHATKFLESIEDFPKKPNKKLHFAKELILDIRVKYHLIIISTLSQIKLV